MKNDQVKHNMKTKHPVREFPTSSCFRMIGLLQTTGVCMTHLWRGDDYSSVYVGGAQVLYD